MFDKVESISNIEGGSCAVRINKYVGRTQSSPAGNLIVLLGYIALFKGIAKGLESFLAVPCH